MSEFIRISNAIKIHRNDTWLTPSQRSADTAIRDMLRVPQTINLRGPVGCGKTFLAWHLADELGYVYLSSPSQLTQVETLGSKGLIIDNCHSDRWAHRDMLKILQMHHILRAIFITRQIIRDYTRSIELELGVSDPDKVCENLSTIGVFRGSDAPNLWYLVNPYLSGFRDQA